MYFKGRFYAPPVIQYQTQKPKIDKPVYSDFASHTRTHICLCVCVCILLCNLPTQSVSCNHYHNHQDGISSGEIPSPELDHQHTAALLRRFSHTHSSPQPLTTYLSPVYILTYFRSMIQMGSPRMLPFGISFFT